jgi:hypothetical protein
MTCYDDEDLVGFFIEELGDEKSIEILEKLTDKLEKDNF